jgi:flavin prenyltransferase
MTQRRVLVALTGASGVIYGRILLEELMRLDVDVHLIVSSSAMLVMKEELGLDFPDGRFDPELLLGKSEAAKKLTLYDEYDLAAAPASGTFRAHGMVICPCSMKTLGALASGTASTLITRAADACLKERRRLVLVPRETPLNLVHLRNMVTLTEAGAVILPASPGFYHRPQTIDELVRHVIMKLLDVLDIEHSIPYRWREE